jgi:hypothetical protein
MFQIRTQRTTVAVPQEMAFDPHLQVLAGYSRSWWPKPILLKLQPARQVA